MQTPDIGGGTEPTPHPREYRVVWSIYVEAATPEDAAREALAAVRDPGAAVSLFEVHDEQERRTVVELESATARAMTVIAGGRAGEPADAHRPRRFIRR